MDHKELSGAHQTACRTRGSWSAIGFSHAVRLRVVLPNLILLMACVIVRDIPADALTRYASISSPYDLLQLLIRLRRPFSRHYMLRHVSKSLSQIFDRRSRPWTMAADSDSTSHALSMRDRSCSNKPPQISPLSYLPSSSLSTSPFAVSTLATLRSRRHAYSLALALRPPIRSA
jgi:hypothetical protein